MRKTISALILLASAPAAMAVPSPGNARVFSGLEQYVYPSNRPPTVAAPAFTADGLHYLALSDDGKRIIKYVTRTGAEAETVMDVANTRENKIESVDGFTLSPDGSKILVTTAEEPVYRHSTRASYYVYELRTRILRPLSENHRKQRSPLFSPDGRMVAFVAGDNNIYLKKSTMTPRLP